jgi:hypothetical protein
MKQLPLEEPLICPMCHGEMRSVVDLCKKCDLMYWDAKELLYCHTSAAEQFRAQYPNQNAYCLHKQYYTVPQMGRILKLKAFL